MKQATNKLFDPGERTYEASDERLCAYQALTLAPTLTVGGGICTFLRLVRVSGAVRK